MGSENATLPREVVEHLLDGVLVERRRIEVVENADFLGADAAEEVGVPGEMICVDSAAETCFTVGGCSPEVETEGMAGPVDGTSVEE